MEKIPYKVFFQIYVKTSSTNNILKFHILRCCTYFAEGRGSLNLTKKRFFFFVLFPQGYSAKLYIEFPTTFM